MAKTTKKNPHHYIAILCGGTGPRLWPMSRASRPKQFIKLFNQQSLLSQTIKRSLKIVSPKNIFIVTNQKYLSQIKKELPKTIPNQNILAEPRKKNTLMAILFASVKIQQIDPQSVITFMPADHFIDKVPNFVKNIQDSAKLASTTKSIVILGIKATRPDPSYGYVLTKKMSIGPVRRVLKFIEKPKNKQAKKLYKKKNVFWNSGIYTLNPQTIFEETEKYQPQYSLNLLTNKTNLAYQQCPHLSIDTAISQKSKRLQLIPATFKWSDVGEWETIYKQLKKDKNKHANLRQSQYLSYQSKGCLIKAPTKKLVGLVGVENLAIIDTEDALLVCDLSRAFNVRDLVGQIVSSSQQADYFLKNKSNK
ncbi:hypothetical protein DRH14_01390 [Candidatus Shapirobacteria bacterium]|nr:MAG: hypothetical protein DRH14_01390 [Candidatus Shapirobacteria bacterium]